MTLLILNILYTVLTLNLFDSELQSLKDRFNASSLEFHQLLTSLSSGQSEFDVRLLIMALIQESNYDLAKARGLNYKLKLFVRILFQLIGVLSKLKPSTAEDFFNDFSGKNFDINAINKILFRTFLKRLKLINC